MRKLFRYQSSAVSPSPVSPTKTRAITQFLYVGVPEHEVAVGELTVEVVVHQEERPALAAIGTHAAEVGDVSHPAVIDHAQDVRRCLDDDRALPDVHVRRAVRCFRC
jgi:hypothetical protein